MSLGGILGTSLLVTLTRPSTWLLALASFLIRGGILWFLVPILTLPTPVGLSNLLGPTLVGFVFGGPTLELFVALFAGAGGVVLWVVGGGLVAAAIEAELIRLVAADEEVTPAGGADDPTAGVPGQPSGRTLRVLAVRLVALAPLLFAMLFGATRIIGVTYAELTLPSDTSVPIVWRVLLAMPDAIVVVTVAWLAGEIVAARATRRVVLGSPSIARALAGGARDVVRHPLETGGLFLVPSVALLLVLVPSAAAASVAWTGLRAALVTSGSPVLPIVALLVFVGLWLGGLALAGVVCAWRQAAWTVAWVRHGRGTFGGSVNGRPGDWKPAGTSGTL